MKIRTGFVSNSSSTSFTIVKYCAFIVPKKYMNDEDIEKYNKCMEDREIIKIYTSPLYIFGYISEYDVDMCEFLKKFKGKDGVDFNEEFV